MRSLRPSVFFIVVILLICNILLINHGINTYLIYKYENEDFSMYDMKKNSYSYELDSGKVVKISFSNIAVSINDCEDLNKAERFEVLDFVYYCIDQKGYDCPRSIRSMEGELSVHIYLCRLNYLVDQNHSADIEYTKDDRWQVLLGTTVFTILGI